MKPVLKKLKVALVNTRIEERQNVPLGLLYLASAIWHICEVKIFDPDIGLKGAYGDIYEIFAFKPDIIAFTSMTQNWERTKEFINAFKIDLPGRPKIIVGGIHATVCPDEVRNTPGVDAVCVGDGEEWLYNYISGENKLFDFDTQFPAYHLMPQVERYLDSIGTFGALTPQRRIDIITGKGCYGKCIYCASGSLGDKIKRRSVVSVVAEIKLRRRQFGNVTFLFTDDTFTANTLWTVKFCRAVKPLKIKWSCSTRADRITESLVKLMKESGCLHIGVGVESGSPAMLKVLKKGVTREQYIEAFRILHKYRIMAGATFILGTPGETEKDIELTKSLLRTIKPNVSSFFYMTPFPGTELYDMVKAEYTHRKPIGTSTSDCPVLYNPAISNTRYIEIRKELDKLTSWWTLQSYLHVSTLWWVICNMTPKRAVRLLHTWHTKTMYDALYEFLQSTRKD